MRFSLLFCLFILHVSCQSPDTKAPIKITEQIERIESTGISREVDSNNPERSRWQKPSLVIDKMGDLSDKIVADIGAGLGYFAFRLAFKAKKVIAIDIDTSMINFMNSVKLNLPDSIQQRLDIRLATAHNPMLERVETDIALIVNTLAYIENKDEYLRNLRSTIRSEGKLIIMDYKMKNLAIKAPPKLERIHLSEVEELLQRVGYKNIVSDDTSLDFQYIVFASVD